MKDRYFDFIVHGGDYNPDQWQKTREIWDEDIRLMKLSKINSATVGIFSWSALEPEEGVYTFEWLDEILDKLDANGISVILATPSGARPAWLAQKYPEVLRVDENGIRADFGTRHNHCLTSPVYREKVRRINTLLAERYQHHPALKMWHISNEYSGECHCGLCQQAFRDWVREYYHNDIEELNDKWWNGFWSHRLNSFDQVNSPKERGENCISAMKLCWRRFVTAQHISFFENEIAPLRALTPDIPITTNFMRMYDGINYQEFAGHLDLISWDNYPEWDAGDNIGMAANTAFVHDVFRSMKDGRPFFMMESTPSIVNWHGINKIPAPGTQELEALQAVAHGADSVQYFQWRKSRGGHEKYHGAVVDHCGTENTRVFREVAHTGAVLEKLADAVGKRCESKVAVICDWENLWATKYYCGYNNEHREYAEECEKWYRPFWRRGISTDVIPMNADFSKYDLVIAPYLYLLKDGVEEKIKKYVADGGSFVTTYLFALADSDDRCFLGGFPANSLKEVFGVWAEETDSFYEDRPGRAEYNGKEYTVDHICDVLRVTDAQVLGRYRSEFYTGEAAVTVHPYGKGRAHYAAFRNDADFADDFCGDLIGRLGIRPDAEIETTDGVVFRKRGELIFVLNFSDEARKIVLNGEYEEILSKKRLYGKVTVQERGYLVLKK